MAGQTNICEAKHIGDLCQSRKMVLMTSGRLQFNDPQFEWTQSNKANF